MTNKDLDWAIDEAEELYCSDDVSLGDENDNLALPDGTINMFIRGKHGVWVRLWGYVKYPENEETTDDN